MPISQPQCLPRSGWTSGRFTNRDWGCQVLSAVDSRRRRPDYLVQTTSSRGYSRWSMVILVRPKLNADKKCPGEAWCKLYTSNQPCVVYVQSLWCKIPADPSRHSRCQLDLLDTCLPLLPSLKGIVWLLRNATKGGKWHAAYLLYLVLRRVQFSMGGNCNDLPSQTNKPSTSSDREGLRRWYS